MDITEQTILQVERFLRKVAQKFPESEETSVLTDIHVRVSQDSGELLAFDDDDKEITRCVVEQWIDNKDENFYDEVAKQIEDGKAAEGKHEIISKPKGKYAPKESGKKKSVEEELFIKTAGDI
mgnify:CR=1 FL=1